MDVEFVSYEIKKSNSELNKYDKKNLTYIENINEKEKIHIQNENTVNLSVTEYEDKIAEISNLNINLNKSNNEKYKLKDE